MTAEDRIDYLELRLSNYIEALHESVEQRDRLAIDAAWGSVQGLQQAIWTALPIGACYLQGYRADWQLGLSIAVGFIAGSIAAYWTNNMRMKEVERFYRLPAWRTEFGTTKD